MRNLSILLLFASLSSAQVPTGIPIIWNKVWPPAGYPAAGLCPGGIPCNNMNGYEDIQWDPLNGKLMLYTTNDQTKNSTNTGNNNIYSIRLHYFDPVAVTDTNIGDNGQTTFPQAFASTSTWPASHHIVGQYWVDKFRHRLYSLEGVGTLERILEQWYFPLLKPISGNTWTEIFPPSLATNHTGEKGAWYTIATDTLAAPLAPGDMTVQLTHPGYATANDFWQVPSTGEIFRLGTNASPYMTGASGYSTNTFASNPTPAQYAIFRFTDAIDSTHCTGGGSSFVLCYGDGTKWNYGGTTETNPYNISRNQYGTSNGGATAAAGATINRLNGAFDNGKVVHDTYHDAFFWLGSHSGDSFGHWYVYCDTTANPTAGTLTSRQTAVGCTRADDWVNLTSKSICAGTGCAASNEGSTNGPNSGKLPHGWYYPTLDWDPELRQIVHFAGGINGIQYQNSYLYDPETFTWTQLNTTCSGAQCTGLLSITVTAAGSGYTTAPTVSISGCTGATATAILSGGTVGKFVIDNFGTACTAPTVTLTGGGFTTPATAAAVANGGTAPPVFSSNSENTRIAHAFFQGKMYYHQSVHSAGPPPWTSTFKADWVLDPLFQNWTELQTGQGPQFTESMTVDPATGTLYVWAYTCTISGDICNGNPGPNGEIWAGKIVGSPNGSPGLGKSSFRCVDVDGDGFGVGPGCLGADADDSDATVHTVTDATTKWGSLQLFWQHLGWNPNNVIYVDGGTGSCTKQAPPFTYSATTACATIDTAISHIVAGDAVVVRAGTYNRVASPISLTSGILDSTNLNICKSLTYYLSYPGELPDFEWGGTSQPSFGMGFFAGNQSCVVIDGMKLYQACMLAGTCGGGGYGISNSGPVSGASATRGVYGFYLTHNYVAGWSDDIKLQYFQDYTNVLHNYLADAIPGGDLGHVIYLGGNCPYGLNDVPCNVPYESTGTLIQGNILARGWNSCIHGNGPMQGVTLDANLLLGCHKEIMLQSGIHKSNITNNVSHTTGNVGFAFDDYVSGFASNNWQCHNQNYNVVANNTFFQDGWDSQLFYTYPVGTNNYVQGMDSAFATVLVVNDSVSGGCASASGVTTTATFTSGSNTITVGSGADITTGKYISGSGLPVALGTYVVSGSATSWVLSQSASGSGTFTVFFPPDLGHNFYTNNVLVHSCGSLGCLAIKAQPTATVTMGSPNITVSSSTSITTGQYVYGNNIPVGTTVASGSGTSWVLSAPATGSATGQYLNFVGPSTAGPVVRYQDSVTPGMTTIYLQSDTWINNILQNADVAGNIIDPLGNSVFQPCSWFTNVSNVPLATGTLCNSNPQFVAADGAWANWNATPSQWANWNLQPVAASPALNAANPTVAATFDILGVSRDASIGAFELGAGCSIGLSPVSPGPYTVGQSVSITATANSCTAGGTPAWTSSGLPTGLSGCNSVSGATCTITGTVTSATGSPFALSISLSDTGGDMATTNASVVVDAAPIVTTTCPMPSGTVGTSYSGSGLVTNSGGLSPYTWSISAGALPSGLSISPSTLSTTSTSLVGTPLAAGTSSFTLMVTDANGIVGTEACSLTVNPSTTFTPPTQGVITVSGGQTH